MKERDVDAATMFLNAPTNPPVGAIKLVRAPSIKLQEWDGAAWGDKVLSIEGGGTGSATAAGARGALGLGTIATQNANAVAITGGTATLDGLNMKATITMNADNSYDLGEWAKQVRKGYFKSALVLPVGVDKFATS